MNITLYRKFAGGRSETTWPFHAAFVQLGESGRYQRADYIEALAVVGGEGRYAVETSRRGRSLRRLEPGSMFLYRPSDVTRIEGNPSRPLSLLMVAIPLGDWQIFADFAGIDPSWYLDPEPPMAFFDPSDEAALAPLYTALRRFREGAGRLDLFRFMTDVTGYFLPLADRTSMRSGAPAWLARSVDAMQQEENLRGGVVRLGGLAHVSPSHLSRTVRRFYGVTPSALLNDLRLRRAAVLLGTTDDSVASIATRCGFASATYFTNRFRRAYDVTPRGYRARLAEPTWLTSTVPEPGPDDVIVRGP